MLYQFQVGKTYRRRDVYKIIGIPEDTKGGNWDTGYASYENDWFIFCNVGVMGRTGHDYANKWIDTNLEWYGKNNSQLRHGSIQSIINPENNTYIFWRENNEQPFIFAGIGITGKVEDVSPVKVIWTFDNNDYPDEIVPTNKIFEGSVSKIYVNSYERNPLARKKCIEHYDTICCVCSFDFENVFGELGKGFIHVHHIQLISEIGEEYEINPIEDLRPVCPNCHAMIHKKKPPFTIEELKEIIELK